MTIESDLQPTNLGLNSAWLRAQDRSKWRLVVETAMLTAGRATWWWWWWYLYWTQFLRFIGHHFHKCELITMKFSIYTTPCHMWVGNTFSIDIITSMVCSTKVLCPQKLFLRKSQRYKGRMSHYVDIWHLCFWHWHVLWLLLTKSWYFAVI